MSGSERPDVLVTEPLAPTPMVWLGEHATVHECASNAADLSSHLALIDGLVVRTETRVDATLLDHAPHLRVVGRAGVGLENIDLPECSRRGVDVVYTPEANTQAVVEFVLALLTDAYRPRSPLTDAVGLDDWRRLRRETVGRYQLDELTIGILGMGRIGRRVAEVAAAIGMTVQHHDIEAIDPAVCHGSRSVDVTRLFETSDVLTVHIDGRPSNRSFVDACLLSRTRDHLTFINASRGFVVDKIALAERLAARPRASAWLDVHEPEPIEPGDPLLSCPNAHLYPHIAARTERALENMSWVVRDVVAVLRGETPRWRAPITASS